MSAAEAAAKVNAKDTAKVNAKINAKDTTEDTPKFKGPDPGIPSDPDYFSQGGTKPYISDSELWWYTFFGFNYFAVNEPLWGLAKLLTWGGFGLWWLWDLVFITSNGAFVQRNGFPAPFHVSQRLFGQGAISKGPAPFRQQSTYGLWALSTFLAPLGVQAIFEQNYPLFIRNMMNLMIILYTGYVVFSYIFIDGLDSLSFFGWIWLMIIGSIFLTDLPTVLLPWYNTVKVAFDPQTLMKQGIPFTNELDAYVNGFKDDVEKINTKELAKEINTKWAIGGTNREYLESLFTPRTAEEIAEITAKNNINKKEDRQTNVWDIAYLAVLSPWLKSFTNNTLGVLEFIASSYGVPVDKIKEILKKGFGGLSELTNVASGAGGGGLGGASGLGALGGLGGALGGLGALGGASGPLGSLGGASGPLGGLGGLSGGLAGGLGGLSGGLAGKAGGIGDLAGKAGELAGKAGGIGDLAGKAGGLGGPLGALAGAQTGGAREEGLSTEAVVLGSTVAVILGAGAFKLAINYLIPN